MSASEVIASYWSAKEAVWQRTTWLSEMSRFKTLQNIGWPHVEPQAAYEQLALIYRRYTIKQIFIRARCLEKLAYGTDRYGDWLKTNPEVFRGCYIGRVRTLTDADVARIERHIRLFKPELLNAFILMAYAGLRKQEALNVCWDHLSKHAESLLVVQGKGRKDRKIPFLEKYQKELRPTLGKYVCMAGYRRQKFIDRMIKSVAESLDRLHFTPHDLRAYALSRYSRTLSVWQLREFAGHASVATTQKYVVSDQLDMKRRLHKLSEEETPYVAER